MTEKYVFRIILYIFVILKIAKFFVAYFLPIVFFINSINFAGPISGTNPAREISKKARGGLDIPAATFSPAAKFSRLLRKHLETGIG